MTRSEWSGDDLAVLSEEVWSGEVAGLEDDGLSFFAEITQSKWVEGRRKVWRKAVQIQLSLVPEEDLYLVREGAKFTYVVQIVIWGNYPTARSQVRFAHPPAIPPMSTTGFAKETVFGTPVTPTAFLPPS